MEFSVKIEGLERIHRAMQSIRDGVAIELKAGLNDAGHHVRTEAIKSMKSGEKSGRVYKIGKTVNHQASAPGEAPAVRSGALSTRGVNVSPVKGFMIEVVARMMSGGKNSKNYAYELEFGNKKVAARPFMFPALEKSKAWIMERLNQAVRKGATRK